MSRQMLMLTCAVTADFACGTVTLREETDYPYSGKMTIRVVEGGDFPRWEIRAKSPWNYVLALDSKRRLANARVVGSGRATEIRVKARRTEMAGWGFLRADAKGRAVDPPHSPVPERFCTDSETISLVPLSETQIRITLFPWFAAHD